MFKEIFKFTKPYRSTLLWIMFLVLLMSILSQVEPFITKAITDQLISEQNSALWKTTLILLGVLLVVKLVQALFNRISWYLTNIFVIKFESSLKQKGFEHLMRLSLSFFNEQETGKVMSKLDRGVNRLTAIVNNSGMHFLPSVITALISFSIVLYYEWRIGALTVLAFVPYVLINRWRFNRNNKLERQEYKLYDKQYAHFWEVLSSMELIKAFRSEEYEKRKLGNFFKKIIAIRSEMEKNVNKSFIGDVILETLSWSMYAYIVYITWQGQITVGTLILLVGLIQLIRQPLWQINWIFWEVKRAQIGAKDFFKIINVKPSVLDPIKPVKLDRVEGKIVFENLSFAYKKEMANYLGETEQQKLELGKKLAVFKNVSFEIEPGKMTALVGPSGAGKTTVASLLMRFFDPDSGRILLDGVDICELSQRDLRSFIGLVSQDAHLFASSIEENLRYAKPTATEAEMWQACRVARADEFIKKLPAGLKTNIGERGVKLSGGQRQRLSLARTILQNPAIIILDEATSALDSESEMYIQQALVEVLRDRTSIVIAHRLSTVQRSDKIIVLKDKQVLEQGKHQELLAIDGLYASLFKIQSGDSEKLKEWDLVR